MSRTDHLERFDVALHAESPSRAIHDLAFALRGEGIAQVELYNLFIRFFTATDVDDPRYDAIADTLDLIWGGPIAKGFALYPSELSNAEIEKYKKEISGGHFPSANEPYEVIRNTDR